MMQMGDAVIASIREARHQISEEHDHDPQKVVAYYMELQKQYQKRLLEPPQTEEELESTRA
jgi:hypothetical protein